MATQTLELDPGTTQNDQNLTSNFNNLTLTDTTEPKTDGWGWDDDIEQKPEENASFAKGYNEISNESWGWEEKNENFEQTNENFEEKNGSTFPVRNGEPDCLFYMKTGSCKFGLNCKFNHPVNQMRGKMVMHGKVQENFQPGELNVNGASLVMYGQTNAEKSYKEKKWGDYAESNGKIDCKYYSTPGGCKYGSACKYFHKEKTEVPVEFNFLGLPVRPGEKECAYYMSTGNCKYSTNCKFHHPDPIAVGGKAPLGVKNDGNHQQYALPVHQNGRPHQPYAMPAHQNGGSHQQYVLPAHQNGGTQRPYVPPAQVPMAPWPLHRSPNEAVPYINTSPSYVTTGYFLPPQGIQPNAEWNGYQAPANQMYPTEMTKPQPPTTSTLNGFPHKVNHFAPDLGPNGDYPERPGQPECQFFMKTGDCKFKAACKYHHPKSRHPRTSEVNLSPVGLPLRPDQPVCTHFSRHGICKFGRTCRYHHPEELNPSAAPNVVQESTTNS